MSTGKPDERAGQTSGTTPVGGGALQATEESTSGSPSTEEDNGTKLHYEALAQRINDTYARFTPEEMEMVKWLGWG